ATGPRSEWPTTGVFLSCLASYRLRNGGSGCESGAKPIQLAVNLKAEMVQGNLDVLWENSPTRGERGIYKILFTATHERGAVKHQRCVHGAEHLREFF